MKVPEMAAPLARALPAVLLVAAAILAGCASTKTEVDQLVPVEGRAALPYAVDGYYSHTLHAGQYAIGKGAQHLVDVALPADPGSAGAASATGAQVSIGLFLPEGLPAGAKVPVIADIGPYYASSIGQAQLQDGQFVVGEGDSAVTEPAHRLGGFLIENFVPHGYAVAQVSVLGTGDSGGCEDLMGLAEQAGIDEAVSWLGTQDWSNGNVGIIGRSYDGSTPWEAAAHGNEHLKTIVPISGLTGMYELMWRNGTSEARADGELGAIYFAMGVNGDASDVKNVCADGALMPANSIAGVATGSNLGQAGAPASTYWSDRYFFDRAVKNYHGSVYLIQGLQDWNVDPHVVFPRYATMQQTWETKGMFGQWGHMYPDRPSEHAGLPPGEGKEGFPDSVRYDWAQDLLEWFDHYLMGTGAAPALHTEIEDNQGHWRIEQGSWPSADAQPLALSLSKDFTQTSQGPPMVMAATNWDASSGAAPATPSQAVVYDANAGLANETHISGLATFHAQVTPLGSGGQLYVELRDSDADLRLGHAVMDLRFAAGGNTLAPVVPGQPLTAKMEFEIIDALVPAGHKLQVLVSATGRDYTATATPANVLLDDAALTLPTIGEGHGTPFSPPAWSGDAAATPQQP